MPDTLYGPGLWWAVSRTGRTHYMTDKSVQGAFVFACGATSAEVLPHDPKRAHALDHCANCDDAITSGRYRQPNWRGANRAQDGAKPHRPKQPPHAATIAEDGYAQPRLSLEA